MAYWPYPAWEKCEDTVHMIEVYKAGFLLGFAGSSKGFGLVYLYSFYTGLGNLL